MSPVFFLLVSVMNQALAQKLSTFLERQSSLEAAGKVFSAKNADLFKGVVQAIWTRNEEIEKIIMDFLKAFVESGSMTVTEADTVTKGEYSEEMGEVEASLKTDFENQVARIRLNAIFHSFESSTENCRRMSEETIADFCSALRDFLEQGKGGQVRGDWPYLEISAMLRSEPAPSHYNSGTPLPFEEMVKRQIWLGSLHVALQGFCCRFREIVYSPDDAFGERYGDRPRKEVGMELVDDLEAILKELARTNPLGSMVEASAEDEGEVSQDTDEVIEEVPAEETVVEASEEVTEESPGDNEIQPSGSLEEFLAGLGVEEDPSELESSTLDEDFLKKWNELDVISIGLSQVTVLDEAENVSPVSVERVDLEAASAIHPNRKPFRGSLFKIDSPSRGIPVVGSANPLFVERETAEVLAGTMTGLPLNVDPSLRVHNKGNPIGVFMDSWVEGNDFMVSGYLWPGTKKESVSLLASTQRDRPLGMSIEAVKLQTETRYVDGRTVTVLKDIIPTGAAVLLAESATYPDTTFEVEAQASPELEASIESDSITTIPTEEPMTTNAGADNNVFVQKTLDALERIQNSIVGIADSQVTLGERVSSLEASVRVYESEREAQDSQVAMEQLEASKRQERQELLELVASTVAAQVQPLAQRMDSLEASSSKRKGVPGAPPAFTDAVGGSSLEASRNTRMDEVSRLQAQLDGLKELPYSAENNKARFQLEDRLRQAKAAALASV